jgi:intein/homing endonuclease
MAAVSSEVDNFMICTYGPSGIGKCLAGSSEILLADGRVETVAQLVKAGTPVSLPSLGENNKFQIMPVSSFHDNGLKPVFRITTKSKRVLDVTGNHPLLGAKGWTELKDMREGDFIAVPRRLPVFGVNTMPEAQVKFLAYHLANGRFFDSALTFSSGNEEIVQDFKEVVSTFPGTAVHPVTIQGEATIDYSGGRKLTSSAMQFLRDLGLESHASATKFVPPIVFTLKKELVALFLNRYLGCDGSVAATGSISFCSASERMLRQMAHLLLRFGVWGSIRVKYVKGTPYWEWQTNDHDCRTELAKIGIFTKPIQEKIVTKGNHSDRLPHKRKDFFPKIGKSYDSSSPDSCVTRYKAQEVLADPSLLFTPAVKALYDLAHSDIYWDQVHSIEALGEQPTYDLTVPGSHNFVANDIIAHNSTDMGYSFPNALFIAAPGALSSVTSVCGYTPKSVSKKTIQEVTALLPTISGHFDTLVIDDFSFIAEQTFSMLEKKFSGFKLWGELRDVAIEFRDKARYSRVNVVLNAWEQAPKTSNNGSKLRGGPQLAGKLPESIPAMCDVVLRAMHEPARKPWPAVYRCMADPAYVMKDRFNVASVSDPAPMNLGELLRAAGIKISRFDANPEDGIYKLIGLGMEDMVSNIADKLSGLPEQDAVLANEIYKELLAKVQESFGSRPALPFVRWILRDAVDRSVIRLAKDTAESKFSLF